MNVVELAVQGSHRGAGFGAGTKKASTPNPMSGAAKQEHAMVAGCLIEVVSPRMAAEVRVTSHRTYICKSLAVHALMMRCRI